MADFLTDLINKTDSDIFDTKRFGGDTTALKYMIEDNLRVAKQNYKSTFNKITQTGDTLAYYRYELLELDKLDIKTIQNHIKNGTFRYDLPECREYTRKFNTYFKLQNRDKDFFHQFYSYLFEHRDDKNLYLKTLIKDFYMNYTNTTKNGANRVDVSDLTKLLHFIRRGQTPLYNQQYRDFFYLKDIGSIVDIDKEATSEDIINAKADIFEKQYYFINSIFKEIIDNSRPSSTTKNIDPYNFSTYFESFIDKFYITDKGITKYKMIDYSILYFR